MSDNVVSLAQRRATPQEDIPQMLRNLADAIAAGEVEGMPLITTCAVGLGYTRDEPLENGEMARSNDFALYSAGPRGDIFTVRGLLLTVATQL